MIRKALLICAILSSSALPCQAAPDDDLVIHEWGTFTAVAGSDGLALDWRPLNGPSDLPGFVYEGGQEDPFHGLRYGCPAHQRPICRCALSRGGEGSLQRKKTRRGSIRMETPVIYFYARKATRVTLKVGFPKGAVTEWYPQAQSVEQGIDWGSVEVLPGAEPLFPVEQGKSHYYPARATDACPVRVDGRYGPQLERFLFYRGVGRFALPLEVTLADRQVRLTTAGDSTFSHLIVFERRGERAGFRLLEAVEGSRVVERPELTATGETLGANLIKMLVAAGLYQKEARAMLATWQDTWFEEGLRVFGILPRKLTDTVLPLTVTPRPKELVRVLVARIEIITPELEQAIKDEVRALGALSYDTRERATRTLQTRYGRFAEPILRRVLKTEKDPEVLIRIRVLLDALGP